MIMALTLTIFSCQSTNLYLESESEFSEENSKGTPTDSRKEIEKELKALVLRINSDISKDEYEKWLSYLSIDYIDNYNSNEILNEISLSPRLKNRGIILTDLRSYYKWVVMPSRYETELKYIEITEGNRAIAYCKYKGSIARLYELEKIRGEWKITIWK